MGTTSHGGKAGEVSSRWTNNITPSYLNDRLGEYVYKYSQELRLAPSWRAFVKSRQGSPNLHPDIKNIPHSAAPLLEHLRKRGIPVLMKDKPWSLREKDEAVHRGPHPSAKTIYSQFFRQEMMDMCEKNYWVVLPYSQVRHLEELRISPPGVVPQKDRRPRTIVDYTFSKVNDNTVPLAPNQAMQFGRAPQRIVAKTFLANPTHGPVRGMLADMSDAFYRAQLAPDGVAKLGVIVPALTKNEPPLIACPLTLPMGWKESPPWWCAISETITDLAQKRANENWDPPIHRLEHLLPDDEVTAPTVSLPPIQSKAPPLAYFDVFLDDFIALAQGNLKRLAQLRRILLHTMDHVIPPKFHCPSAKDPISVKKLLKGDGSWKFAHKILGWVMNLAQNELHLPSAKKIRLNELLNSISPSQKRISVKKWQKLLGELRSMVWAVPGGEGFFSRLQTILKGCQHNKRLSLSPGTHAEIADWRTLATSLSTRPTSFSEIVPTYPHYIGPVDASGLGMGGVWFPPGDCPEDPPLLWRASFPPKIVAQLITDKNPHGTITNSDLELAATIAHDSILTQECNVHQSTTLTFTDNKAAMYWRRKGSVSTSSPASYLLRLAALHQRTHHYNTTHQYLPGKKNCMADDASRLSHFSDSQILTHFNINYPQKYSWKLCRLQNEMSSALTSALLMRPPSPAYPKVALKQKKIHGSSGKSFVKPTTWIPGSRTSMIQSPSFKSSYRDIGMAASHPVVDRCELERLRMPYAMWGRRFPDWGFMTPELTLGANKIVD